MATNNDHGPSITITEVEIPEVLAALDLASKLYDMTGNRVLEGHYRQLAHNLEQRQWEAWQAQKKEKG